MNLVINVLLWVIAIGLGIAVFLRSPPMFADMMKAIKRVAAAVDREV